MLADLVSSEPVQNPRRKQKSRMQTYYDNYKKKSLDEYSARDLVFYFQDRYYELLNEPYHISLVKESTQMKRLINSFGLYGAINLIEYALRYKRPVSIGMLSSRWSNTWYLEMINKYGTSQDTLKYRCILLAPEISAELKSEVAWKISQAEEAKLRHDNDRMDKTIRNLEAIFMETHCTRPLATENI
jgi:hypothetical protein